VNGSVLPNGNTFTAGSVLANVYPPSPQSPVTFTQEHINALRVHIHAFKVLKSGLPISEKLQQALNPANGSIAGIEKLLQGPNVQARFVDAAVKISKASSE
jgi:ATP-dependent helicase STH1/SNF2